MRSFLLNQLRPAILVLVAMTAITGVAYPAAVTAVAQLVFPSQANGSMIVVNGTTVGSSLIGQAFDQPQYFWGRPSAAGADGYDGMASAGSQLGPTSQALIDRISAEIDRLRAANGDGPIPVDLVTTSASGLDPDISPAAAEYQVQRVATARGLAQDAVRAIVARHTEGALLGFIGQPHVNVLLLNLDLDGLFGTLTIPMTNSQRASDDSRPTGDQMLARIGGPAPGDRVPDDRGRLRVYLGMAPGVGKTFRMLEEAHRRVERGTDVAVGFVETHGRPHTAELLAGLEQVPRLSIVYRGVTIEEMDTDAVIAGHPQVAIVDELAHTNVPGSPHEKRWQDIEQIRDAGIDVISTCNVQHLESVADAVATITGAPVNERLPDSVLYGADEIELVDMSPHALRQRMRHGNVYPPDRTELALDRFFTEANLTALRELSLRFVGGQVDAQLGEVYASQGVIPAAQITERVAVLVSADAPVRRAIRRAASLASALRAPLLAVTVETPETAHLPYNRSRDLRENLAYAVDLGAQLVQMEAPSTVDGLADAIRTRRITQLVVAHARRSAVDRLLHPSLATALFERVPEVELHLVGEGRETPTFTPPAR